MFLENPDYELSVEFQALEVLWNLLESDVGSAVAEQVSPMVPTRFITRHSFALLGQ